MLGVGINLGIPARRRGGFRNVLDGLSPTAAFSMRRLRTAYTGSAIRVRRSSDDAQTDIGFTTTGDLDTVALLAFVGAGSGFVPVWYDQSGNERNVSQPNPGFQPRIVSAGVYNGEADFRAAANASAGRLLFAALLNLETFPYTVNAVMRQVSNSVSMVLGNNAGSIQFFRVDGQATARFTPGVQYGSTFNATNHVVLTQTNSSLSAATGWANGASVGSTTTAAGQGVSTNGIGAWSGNVSNFALREIIVFASALSATDRQALERNQGLAYGIPVA